MNKYKTSIEVKGENIKALFDCPIVTDIKKATDAVDDGLDVTDMLYSVTAVNMAGAHKQVKRGSVLALMVFFIIGLVGLVLAMKRQKVEGLNS